MNRNFVLYIFIKSYYSFLHAGIPILGFSFFPPIYTQSIYLMVSSILPKFSFWSLSTSDQLFSVSVAIFSWVILEDFLQAQRYIELSWSYVYKNSIRKKNQFIDELCLVQPSTVHKTTHYHGFCVSSLKTWLWLYIQVVIKSLQLLFIYFW